MFCSHRCILHFLFSIVLVLKQSGWYSTLYKYNDIFNIGALIQFHFFFWVTKNSYFCYISVFNDYIWHRSLLPDIVFIQYLTYCFIQYLSGCDGGGGVEFWDPCWYQSVILYFKMCSQRGMFKTFAIFLSYDLYVLKYISNSYSC